MEYRIVTKFLSNLENQRHIFLLSANYRNNFSQQERELKNEAAHNRSIDLDK